MSSSDSRPGGPRRFARAALAFVIGCVLAAFVLEFGLRAALFSDIALSKTLRDPARWSSPHEPEYWKLRILWQPPEERARAMRHPDPLLGWRSGAVLEDHTHRAMPYRKGRRPVLLFGDSFAHCLTPAADCFQGIFRKSEFDADHALLNYAAGGYGLDQIYLSLVEAIDHYDGLDPIVIFSVLVSDDLKRMVLDFRERPKPVLRLEGGELVADAPPWLDCEMYLENRPPEITSWAWNLFANVSAEPRKERMGELVARQKLLTRAILEQTQAELDARGIEWFVLFFYDRGDTRATSALGWEEGYLLRVLDELEIPYVSSRPDLWRAIVSEGIELEDLFLQRPAAGAGHLNARGNRAVFETIRRGLAGQFDPYAFQAGERPARESE